MGKRVFVLGATGTIGRAVTASLLARGHDVTCYVRQLSDFPEGAQVRQGPLSDIARAGFCGDRFDVLVSCLASRKGSPADAWAIDYQAHCDALALAKTAGVTQMVLLSAICVQKPLLEFQKAKLAFEQELMTSGLTYSIVRPTAFFKSLSGQVDRLRAGKPFLVFGDGYLTSCKPISDGDLGAFLADCVNDKALHGRILPIGGPGPAISPYQQGERLFELLGKPPKFRRVPVRAFDVIIAVLTSAGRISPGLREKAELAKIGRYYATESMLVLDSDTSTYNADATPETGTETLFDFYERLVSGDAEVDLRDHAVF